MVAIHALLTFEQLREKCLRHLQEVTAICVGGFTNPDPDFLNDEFSIIYQDLRSQKIAGNYQDLVNAFSSAVFEMEHKQKLLPNSLVVLDDRLCRIIKFSLKYPIQIEYRVFRKHGNGKLESIKYSTILNQPIQRVLLIDPLTKNS